MSKISGVPELFLRLSVPGGKAAVAKTIELPVFHPCVRLARWKENPGDMSFVPPDGKFMLAGYEVNLLPSQNDYSLRTTKNLNLPASIEVLTSLGLTGLEFEVRLILSLVFGGNYSNSFSGTRPGLSSQGSGRSTPIFGGGGTSTYPTLHDVVVSIPIPGIVRNITDLRASRGEATFTPSENAVEWRVPTKDVTTAGNATLRCTVVGPLGDDDEEDPGGGFRFDAANGEYDDKEETYQSSSASAPAKAPFKREQQEQRDSRKVQQNAPLMPSSASISFSVRGWLASGVKVETLAIDTRKSRGISEGVKPYKGVKYATISKRGVETRC